MKDERSWLLIAFFACAPITIPTLLAFVAYDSAKRRKKQRREEGNPPRRAPGQRAGDYVDQFFRLPQQWRKYRRLQKKTTDINQHPRIPYELYSIIITHLQHDPSALKNCSLVCRAWVFPARARLFTTLKPIGHAAYDFLTLLRSPYCTIPQHLHRVDLQDTKYWTTVEALLKVLASAEFTVHALNLILWAPFQYHSQFLCLNVTVLNVVFKGQSLKSSKLKSRRNKPLNAVLASFPNLRSLSMTCWSFFDFTPDSMLPPPRTLKHLSIQAAHPYRTLLDRLFKWFFDPAFGLELESISYFSDFVIPPSTYLAGFLKTPRGQALKSLEVLVLRDHRPDENSTTHIPLDVYFPPHSTPLPNLTTFQLRLGPGLSPLPLLSALRRILPRFPNLQCLALRWLDPKQRGPIMSIFSHAQIQTVFPFCEEYERGNGQDALGRALNNDILRIYTRPMSI